MSGDRLRRVIPGDVEGEVGQQIQFIATEYGTDCYGTYYTDPLGPGEADWSSSNNNIATVNNYGLATLIGAGDVDIEAEWEVKRTTDQGGYCPTPPGVIAPPDGAEVSEKEDVKKEDSDEPISNRPDCNVCFAYFEDENAKADLDVRAPSNRGRLQAQGPDIDSQTAQAANGTTCQQPSGTFTLSGAYNNGEGTISWAWNRTTDVTKDEALDGLQCVSNALTPTQRANRSQNAFSDAANRITTAPTTGIDAQFIKSYHDGNQPSNRRVDIEVRVGRAFTGTASLVGRRVQN